MFTCISLRPTLLGSTKSNCGLPRSSVMSLRGECSLQSKIWRKSSCVTFGSITTHQKPLNGNILTPVAELNANQLLQLTSSHLDCGGRSRAFRHSHARLPQ